MGVHVKVAGSWREVGLGDIGGGPGWNDVLTVTPTGPDAVMSWPAAAGAVASYEVNIDGVITNVGNVLTYSKPGLSQGPTHSFRVRAKDAAGVAGGWSTEKTAVVTGWNAATGGTETTVPNYNGTGQTWKVHTFTTSGDFVVTKGAMQFKALVVGGGGGGIGNTGSINGQAGNGATGVDTTVASLAPGTFPVVVGAGGQGSSPAHSVPGSAAGSSSAIGLSGPGAGGPGGGGGGWNHASTITGTSDTYGRSAPGPNNGATPGQGYGGGGGMCTVNNCGGAAGSGGIVVIAYRVG